MPPKLLCGHPILLRDPRVARRDNRAANRTPVPIHAGQGNEAPGMVPITEKATLCLALSPPCRLRARGTPARGVVGSAGGAWTVRLSEPD